MELFQRVASPDGGFTYHATSDKSPKEGFALSPYPDRSMAFSLSDFRFGDLVSYYSRNKDILIRAGHYLGAWHDPASGKIFLDVSVVKQTRGDAARLARDKDQIAYYSLAEGKSVTVNPYATSGGAVKP